MKYGTKSRLIFKVRFVQDLFHCHVLWGPASSLRRSPMHFWLFSPLLIFDDYLPFFYQYTAEKIVLWQKIVHPIVSCVLVQEAEVIIEDKKWGKKLKTHWGPVKTWSRTPQNVTMKQVLNKRNFTIKRDSLISYHTTIISTTCQK